MSVIYWTPSKPAVPATPAPDEAPVRMRRRAAIRRPCRKARHCLAAYLCLAIWAPAVGAQTRTPSPARSGPSLDLYVQRPNTAVAALTLAVPAGARHDPTGAEGTARILGDALRRQLERALPASAHLVDVTVDHELLSIRVVTEPTDLNLVIDAVWRVTMQTAPEGPDIDAARTFVEGQIAFSEGAPAERFRAQQIRQLFGEGHLWARPLAGTPTSRQRASAALITEFWDRHVRNAAEIATLTAVGPAPDPFAGNAGPNPERASSSTADDPATTARRTPDASRPANPVSPTQAPRRTHIQADITATWIALTRPVTAEPAIAALFLATVRDRLFHGPSSGEIITGSAGWLDLPEGRHLKIEIAVPPQSAEFWVEAAVQASSVDQSTAAAASEEAALFHWRKRRLRNQLLMEVAAPQDLSLQLARDLALSRDPTFAAAGSFGRGLEPAGLHAQILAALPALRASQGLPGEGMVGPGRIFSYGPRLP